MEPDLKPSAPPPSDPTVVMTTITPASASSVLASAPRRPSLDEWMQPATRWLGLLVATAIVAYLCWLLLAPFIDVLMWAIVLTVAFTPVHRRIRSRFKSPSIAAALSSLLVIVVILIPLSLLTLAVIRDATDMAHALQDHKEELLDPNADNAFARSLRWVDRYVDVDRYRSQEYLGQRLRDVSGVLARRTLNVVGGLVGAVVDIFLVIFTLFYLFRDGDRLKDGLRAVLPLDRWQSHEVFVRTREVIQASLYGSLVIAAVQGALGGVAFWVLGVPSPLLWGAVMILVCMIPMAGAFLIWAPAALYLVASGHPVKAGILAAWGILVIGTIDNVLRPKLVGPRAKMHELMVFFAVLGGIQVFGVLGLITGPMIAAVALALFEIWRRWKPPVTNTSSAQPVPAQAEMQAPSPT